MDEPTIDKMTIVIALGERDFNLLLAQEHIANLRARVIELEPKPGEAEPLPADATE